MQSNIFHLNPHNSLYVELCAALYERELTQLSYQEDNAETIRRKLRSLPFYVKKAAWLLLQAESPLTLDSQNASWLAPQKNKPPKLRSSNTLAKWLDLHVAPGLPLALLWQTEAYSQVLVDTVDRIDYSNQKLHLNRWGWCSFQGESLSAEPIYLLKPTPTIMAAACAGHRWNQQGRLAPQPLSLRELLLTSLLSWPNFQQAKQL